MNIAKKPTKQPMMSVLTLIMINVIAIDSLRSIPMGAHYGFSLVFYYLIAALAFFIPSALVSAELATGWPQTGGIYVWVREAFGIPVAFLVIWIQWIYNICWYPTILSFLAATLAYIINPQLAHNIFYMLSIIFVVYWSITIVTLFGMRASGTLSTITAIVGTIVPMAFITILGIIWIVYGEPIHITFSVNSFLPKITKPNNLVLLTGVVYGLIGMEMSAIHAQEVKDPQTNYPKALYYSTIIILVSLVLASLAVAIVVPAKQLNLVTGLLEAFLFFFRAFGLSWLMPIVAILIIIGAIGGIGAWVIGPTRGLLVAAQDGCIPPILQKTNSRNMPIAILITQGLIFTIICSVFLIMPSINSSFWILSDLTAQLAVSCYIFMFAAAIWLRYKHPRIKRTYKIPFGNFGIWVVGIFGIIASLFTLLIGYFPPTQFDIGSIVFYEAFLIIGFIVFYSIPLVIYKLRKRSWKLAKPIGDELLADHPSI